MKSAFVDIAPRANGVNVACLHQLVSFSPAPVSREKVPCYIAYIAGNDVPYPA
jgi:hypothetical protein